MGIEKMKKDRFLALTVFTISSGFLATTLAISPAVAQTEITFWHAQSDGAGPKLIQDAVDRFEADNPTIKVVRSLIPAAFERTYSTKRLEP